ncbi:hypothetical protein MAXJ12_23452, partial [Mesorhizobium alhagi CCNWXJ12-2]
IVNDSRFKVCIRWSGAGAVQFRRCFHEPADFRLE